MKKLLDGEIVTRNSYTTTVVICVGEFEINTSFWAKVLETARETGVR
jgi:hypothetical protein